MIRSDTKIKMRNNGENYLHSFDAMLTAYAGKFLNFSVCRCQWPEFVGILCQTKSVSLVLGIKYFPVGTKFFSRIGAQTRRCVSVIKSQFALNPDRSLPLNEMK